MADHQSAQTNGIRGTFCVNGRCAEIFPEAVAQIVKSGHDVAGHAYLQDQLLAYMTPEEEQRTIRQCLDLLEKATGMRPQGWVSPVMAYTAHTRDFLAAEGLIWNGDARDTDLPRMATTKSGPIAQIPISDFTDNRVLRSSSLDLWEVHKETFDFLYQHEVTGLPGAVDALPFRRPADDLGDLREAVQIHGAVSRGVVRVLWRDRALGDRAQARADPRRLLKA